MLPLKEETMTQGKSQASRKGYLFCVCVGRLSIEEREPRQEEASV
jgi:hypothetical protein